jgi:hypothetical protein
MFLAETKKPNGKTATHGSMSILAIFRLRGPCYDCDMFNFGKPKTAGDWIVYIAGAVVAILLVCCMLRTYILCLHSSPLQLGQ